MSTGQLTDYYVGMMRGYLLAKDAPQQVLQALDHLLTGYRSRAGALIGESEPDGEEKEEQQIESSLKITINGKEEPEKKKLFWTKKEDEILEEMYCVEGKKPKEIGQVLNRKPSSVSARINAKGLKRGPA